MPLFQTMLPEITVPSTLSKAGVAPFPKERRWRALMDSGAHTYLLSPRKLSTLNPNGFSGMHPSSNVQHMKTESSVPHAYVKHLSTLRPNGSVSWRQVSPRTIAPPSMVPHCYVASPRKLSTLKTNGGPLLRQPSKGRGLLVPK